MKPHLRIIGDVHAQIDSVINENGRSNYLKLTEGCTYSIQLGDLGDAIAYQQIGESCDPARHKFLPGNHDDYDHLPPHALGDFGQSTLGGVPFFFVRGAQTSDQTKRLDLQQRLGKKLWWEEEELTLAQVEQAVQAYRLAKPRLMLSHDCPASIRDCLLRELSQADSAKSSGSRTCEMLEQMLQVHRPEIWLFGHYHQDWKIQQDGTLFQCLGELSFVDLDEAGIIVPSFR